MKKGYLTPLLVVFMLITQMMSPVVVFADGGTPPPEATEMPPIEETNEETVVSETDTEIPADETPTEEVTSEIDVPSDEEIVPTESDGTEKTEDLTIAEVFEQAPENTDVVVVNKEGEIEPLATQEAAEIVEEADPIWCPDGQSPTPGTNGCSPSFTTMTDVINWLITNDPDAAGTVWIEDGYDSASEGVTGFEIDGGDYTNLDNHALTIQGGWDGNSGSTTITGKSTFNGDYLHITNWSAKVTLNNIAVQETADAGIVVTTTEDISLENVSSNEHDDDGAYLDNMSGSGSVTITGTSTFNNNGDSSDGEGDNGLEIYSNGDVTIDGVNANGNYDDGIDVEVHNAGSLTITNTTAGSSVSTGNGDDGLDIETDGSVFLENITAIGNDDNGAYVDASHGDEGITTRNSTFSQNGDEGFEGYADLETILFYKVIAIENDEFGIWLENRFGDITLQNIMVNTNGLGGALLTSAVGDITITNGQFNNNGDAAIPDCVADECEFDFGEGAGLTIINWGGEGKVLLKKIQSSANYGDGAIIIGDDVRISHSTFNNNGQYDSGADDLYADGLYIEDTEGGPSSAYLKCVQANNNAAFGIEIYAEDTTLNSVFASQNIWDNFYLEHDSLTMLDDPCSSSKDDKTWQIISVISGQSIQLNCTSYLGTILILPNKDLVRFPCPTLGQASLSSLAAENFPAPLPDGTSFVSALTAYVTKDGVGLVTLPKSMIVSFLLDDNMLNDDLAILYWGGTEWIELPDIYQTDNGRLEVASIYTGHFVLVKK